MTSTTSSSSTSAVQSSSPLSPTDPQNVNRTREAVQRVYKMLEKHKPATSCDEDEDFSPAPHHSRRSSSSLSMGSSSSAASNAPSQSFSSQQRRGGGGRPRGGGTRGGGGGGGRQQRQPRNANNQRRSAAGQSISNDNCDNNSNTNDNVTVNAVPESEEEAQLARLRCGSEATEAVSEREKRRRKRCADYPGFALVGGVGSVFASDTMMKFSIIQNELHNVINGQLKRVKCIMKCRTPASCKMNERKEILVIIYAIQHPICYARSSHPYLKICMCVK